MFDINEEISRSMSLSSNLRALVPTGDGATDTNIMNLADMVDDITNSLIMINATIPAIQSQVVSVTCWHTRLPE